MNTELITALDILEKEKKISKKVLIEAIENSLLAACKNHFGKNENFTAKVDPKTGDFKVTAAKEVVETVEDSVTQISLADAQMISPKYNIGDTINVEIKSAEFGRIAVQNSKSAILQKIREEERQAVYNEYHAKEKDIVTGIVSRYAGNNLVINLGRADAILSEADMVKGEKYKPNDRIKVYVTEVKTEKKGLKIAVSRCHPEFVKRLFEAEVAELRDGTVEIRSIAREAGSRTKMAVYSNSENVDAVGACVGQNGSRVDVIVNELKGEKIDIIPWSEDPAEFIAAALRPANVVAVEIDENEDEKSAKVVVPDNQLSLAIGKEGQNVRLAARLTGWKIDIKSESQARSTDFIDFDKIGNNSEVEETIEEETTEE